MENGYLERVLATCRIKLTQDELNKISKDIDEILGYFDTISEADCDGYDPAFQPITIPPKLRDDKADTFGDVPGLLKNSKIYRFYVVGPKV